MRFSIYILILALALGSCTAKTEKIRENKWQLVEIISSDTTLKAPSNEIVINFTEPKNFVGYGACNNFFGEYSLPAKEKININLAGTTMSFCEDQNFEDVYLSILQNCSTYTIISGELRLNNPTSQITLLYKAR